VPRMPRITAAELLRALHRDGWRTVRQRGSHLQMVHPVKPGYVTVPGHSARILKLKTLDSILEQAGLNTDELRRLL
jgi:predicted RNA binding protein YcfA (HicA-like mRNA interferase family)